MTDYIKLIVIKGGAAYDMSNLVSKVKWSGRKGSSSRTLQVDFIDDDGYKHDRTGIDVEQGHQCIFYWKGEELFRGMFMQQSQSGRKTMSLKAYDNGIYLANNRIPERPRAEYSGAPDGYRPRVCDKLHTLRLAGLARLHGTYSER